MPQLSIETFVSQYFWLALILGTIYYFMVTGYLPLISSTLKARKYLEGTTTERDKSALALKEIVNAKVTVYEGKADHTDAFTKNFNKFFPQ